MKPIDFDKLDKHYYSISEVAGMFDVSASLLRFWETEFPKLKPKKGRSGNRLFQKKDIMLLNTIYNLVKVEGFTLEGARRKLKENKQTTNRVDNGKEVLKRLKAVKARLEELRDGV